VNLSEARRLVERKERLKRFLELGAPDLIVDDAMRLVYQSMRAVHGNTWNPWHRSTRLIAIWWRGLSANRKGGQS